MQDHLERPVSKKHWKQMSWKTVFGHIVPVELADREDKDHDTEKKDKSTLSSVVFYFSRSLEFTALS